MLGRWAETLPVPVNTVLRSGYLAVATFFVLSGFVLARRYAGPGWTRRSLFRYGVSRFARIYPVYLLSLLLVAPMMVMDFRPAWIVNYMFLLQV